VSAPLPAAAQDAILGVAPRLVLEPATVAEAAEAMRALAGDRLAVVFAGGGTDLGVGAAPVRLDALLRTRRLARVVEHAPADQMVAVEAGMTLGALQRHLAAHRQRLALDPPLPNEATLGGILAANAFGPRRARFGGIRDLVIGITVVRADGVVARGGGKVVKNVAGFDLPRLFCGSLGGLGLVAEVVLRLHPLPEVSATVVIPGVGAAAIRALVRAAVAAQLEPVAATAFPEGDRYRLAFRLEGFGPGVRDQVERLAALAVRERLVAEELSGADEAALWAGHDTLRRQGEVWLKATFAPAALEAAEAALRRVATALGGASVLLHPTLGIALLAGPGGDPAAAAGAIESARAALRPLGNGALTVDAAPASLRARVEPWGPAPAAIEVMRRLKHELDPEGRLAPGRLAGGL
jgi:glycolate oxidase FAD binding subunit